MRKTVQTAFAIALVILSVLASVWKTELMNSIIYAIVIPSFILSIISLVNELSEKCKGDAKRIGDLSAQEALQVELKISEENKQYRKSANTSALGVALHEVHLEHLHQQGQTHRETKYVADGIREFCSNCQSVCEKICVGGYVLLFLSLTLSPCFTKWLSVIDLNCISLWSLTLLYFSLEVKASICDWLYKTLHKVYYRKFHSIENR